MLTKLNNLFCTWFHPMFRFKICKATAKTLLCWKPPEDMLPVPHWDMNYFPVTVWASFRDSISLGETCAHLTKPKTLHAPCALPLKSINAAGLPSSLKWTNYTWSFLSQGMCNRWWDSHNAAFASYGNKLSCVQMLYPWTWPLSSLRYSHLWRLLAGWYARLHLLRSTSLRND